MSSVARLKNGAQRARAAARRTAKAALLRATANGAGHGANGSAQVVPDEALWVLEERYRGSFELEPVAFGSVRDFADSADNFPGLVSASADMKNMQRCWMVKAILGNVPAGSRLIEIGAGEPLVAGLLARLGYEVTVVDPYDGSGNGPREYELFRTAYPDVGFVHDTFPPAATLPKDVGCVYSISVLEHVPLDVVGGVVTGAHELLGGPGGWSIHAVDHVLAGWGAESHRAGLDAIVAASGLDAAELERVITRMELDPETYLVSAEAHNGWRGALAYEDYPMRRIGSVNLAVRMA